MEITIIYCFASKITTCLVRSELSNINTSTAKICSFIKKFKNCSHHSQSNLKLICVLNMCSFESYDQYSNDVTKNFIFVSTVQICVVIH